jgi:hypothetical protein
MEYGERVKQRVLGWLNSTQRETESLFNYNKQVTHRIDKLTDFHARSRLVPFYMKR